MFKEKVLSPYFYNTNIEVWFEFYKEDFLHFDDIIKYKNYFPYSDIVYNKFKLFNGDSFPIFLHNYGGKINYNDLIKSILISVYLYNLMGLNFYISLNICYSTLNIVWLGSDNKTMNKKNMPIKDINFNFNELCVKSGHKPKPELIFKSLQQICYDYKFKDFIFNWKF